MASVRFPMSEQPFAQLVFGVLRPVVAERVSMHIHKPRTPTSQGTLRARSEQTHKRGQFNSLSFQNFVPAAAPPIWRPFLVSV